MRIAMLGLLLVACAEAPVPPAPLPAIAAREPRAPRVGAVPELHCGPAPRAPVAGFRHERSRLYAHGKAVHRGDDLIALVDEDQQVTGKLGYTFADKALEDEDVELYACEPGGWALLGRTRTDHDGRFALALVGARRLGAGLRDLYARVAGDGSGTELVAFVAPRGTAIVLVDVDGTLTTAEDAILWRGMTGRGIAAQPDAAAALARAPAQIVYVTARGEHLANMTHRWLADRGFPRGPVRFAPGWFTRPGPGAIAAKTRVLADLAGRFAFAAGIGNRASDVTAYGAAGIAPTHIFVKLPEFEGELAPLLAAHAAVGFASYAALIFPPGAPPTGAP